MAFLFNWRETSATNQERLAADIVKAAAFGVVIGHDVKAAIILANIAMAAKFQQGGTEIAEANERSEPRTATTTLMMTPRSRSS